MLVDDGSAVNILFDSTFNKIYVGHEPTAISEPLFDFTRDSLVPQGRINLIVDFEEPLCHLKKFIKFLVVDTHSAYHAVLGRLTLKDLQAITSIYHFAIKFSTPSGVVKVHGNQAKVRACYINVLQKVAKCEDASPTMMMIQIELMDIDLKKAEEDMALDEGLDLRIICSNSLTSHVEELEAFQVNPLDHFQMLQLG
ncbi:Uncharacterized protein Adt_14613 [Abeliophyllum distichum]|uniref:Uncharacterized protein n=1 Tax=Abeliophyllum distichum TaxID=126358 RepID=A0ABD1U039_9LAMI